MVISLIGILLIYILLNLFSYFSIIDKKDIEQIVFDSTKWKSAINDRWLMKDDLFKSKKLVDQDTNSIKLILGPPGIRIDSTQIWKYNMGGAGHGLGFIGHELNIRLKEGKVINTEYTFWID